MAQTLYTAPIAANVALVATTAKSVLGVAAPAQFGVDLRKIRLSFDGVTASDKAVLVEVCAATFATNAPGTNSTSITVQQVAGRSITAGFTAAYGWTAEPTVLTVIDSFTVSPYNGTILYDFPLGDSPDSAVSQGFVIRCTAPTSAVNVRGAVYFGRC
jgi:hypothetical protein